MKQAVIDIGSNSMRLTVYETEDRRFTVLFKEKIMAGLAGYVEDGVLSQEGITQAYQGLLAFQSTLRAFSIPQAAVFATASLRNIRNTREAVNIIESATGFPIAVISGREEARCGFEGAMVELNMTEGIFLDIGGASTEVVPFAGGKPLAAESCPVGSLKLYRECVKKILPGKSSLERMEEAIAQATRDVLREPVRQGLPLACVGGTARAAMKLARRVYRLPDHTNRITAQQLNDLCGRLCASQKTAADLILKLEPERIHTMIPGLLILRHVAAGFQVSEMVVSQYGVREGYLCRKILNV